MIERRETKKGPRYEVRMRGTDGHERSRTFRTRRDAERYERDQRSALDRGDWIDPRGALITFAEFAQKWLGQRSDLRPRTVEIYASMLRNHLFAIRADAPQENLSCGSPFMELRAG